MSPALGSRALRSLLAAAAPLPHQVPTSRCSRRSLLPLFRIAQLPARREASPSCPANHPPTGPPPPHLARQLSCPPLPWAWEALFGSLPRPFPKIWSRLTNKSPPQSPCAPSSVLGPQSPHPHPYPYLSTPDPSAFHPPGICPFLSPCNSGVILYIQKTVFSVI